MANVGTVSQVPNLRPVGRPERDGFAGTEQNINPENQGGYSHGAWEISRLVPNYDHQARLFRWGLNTPSKVRFWGGGPIRRFLSALATGIPNQVMKAYAMESDLMRVPAMQADWARLLFEVGVRSPVELAQYGGDDIAAKIQRGVLFASLAAKSIELAANEGRVYSPPTFDELGQAAHHSRGIGPGVT